MPSHEMYMTRPPKKTPSPKPALKPAPKPAKPSSPSLKNYLDATKTETVVLSEVDRFLQLKRDDRATDVIHPSEMAQTNWCVKATYQRLIGMTPPPNTHRLQTNLIFGEGHDIHAKWQRWFQEMGILYGAWRCEACHREDLCQITELPVRGCPNQVEGVHLWRYKEVPYTDVDVNVSGHSDALIYPKGTDYLVEVKSIGPGSLRKLAQVPEDEVADEDLAGKFSRVTHVLGDHYRQLQIYMRLSQKTDRPVSAGVVIYENKPDQQVREFRIEYDSRATDDLFNQAADIMWHVNKGKEIACSNAFDGCAQCKGWT